MSALDANRSRLAWWTIGAVLAVALLFVVHSFVGTFVFGIFIYYSTRPIYRRIRRRIPSANLAAGVAIFALVLPALALVAYALLIIFLELSRLSKTTQFDPTAYGIDQNLLNRIADPQALLTGDLTQYLSFESVGGALASLGSAIGTLAIFGLALVHLFIMAALAFYLLRDDHRLARWFFLRFGDDRGVLESYLRTVDRDLNTIFFGNILNAVLTGTIGVIAYSTLNVFAPQGTGVAVPAPALVGLLAGVASLIPVVGMKLVYIPVAIYLALLALVSGETSAFWFVLEFFLVSFVIVDTIPDLVLRPYVSGRSLHVGAVMLAYTLGPLLFGWYGIFLMPMLLVLIVHFAQIVLPELLAGAAIRPYAVDPSVLVGDEPGATDRSAEPDGEDPAADGGDGDEGNDDRSSTDV